MDPKETLKTRPKNIAMIGLGRSYVQYVGHKVMSQLQLQFDEVWTVNFGMDVFRHDKVFVMDDLRVQAKAMPQYGLALRDHDKPIITSQSYPEFPMSVTFPIKEVVEKIGDDFLNSSVAFAVAWAIYIGAKNISMYGCDFHYPESNRRELGGQCCAYLLGLGRHFGMQFQICEGSTLMDAHSVVFDEKTGKAHRPLYGYAEQPLIGDMSVDGTNPNKDSGIQEGQAEQPAGDGEAQKVDQICEAK